MAITVLPAQTEGSGPEDLGQAKSDDGSYTDPATQLSAVNHNNIVTNLIAVANEVGLSDGSTVGSLNHKVKLKPVGTKTSAYTVTINDDIVPVDTTSGNVNLTLFAPGGVPRGFMVKKVAGGTNKITLLRSASENIEGIGASYDLPTSAIAYSASVPQAWYIWTDGTNWFVA